MIAGCIWMRVLFARVRYIPIFSKIIRLTPQHQGWTFGILGLKVLQLNQNSLKTNRKIWSKNLSSIAALTSVDQMRPSIHNLKFGQTCKIQKTKSTKILYLLKVNCKFIVSVCKCLPPVSPIQLMITIIYLSHNIFIELF